MEKIFLILILLIFITSTGNCQTLLTGSVDYNVDSARTEAFQGIKYSLSRNSLQKYQVDPDYVSNYTAVLRGNTRLDGRTIATFSDGTYGVRFDDDLFHNYYYNANGSLFKVDELDKPDNVYPHRSVSYDRTGALMQSALVISKNESYIYNLQKKLIAHWVGENCFDENGRIQMTRKFK